MRKIIDGVRAGLGIFAFVALFVASSKEHPKEDAET